MCWINTPSRRNERRDAQRRERPVSLGGLRPMGRLAMPSLAAWFALIALVGNSAAEDGPSAVETSQERQARLEADLAEQLSGATLEGSFTRTGPERDPADLSPEKYTLGEVKKLADGLWLFPARIQYGEHDVTLPITLPIQWAGDTPVVVVDNVGLPGFGTVSARVLFFDGHYAGYWRHGERGGHLFGVIHPRGEAAAGKPTDSDD